MSELKDSILEDTSDMTEGQLAEYLADEFAVTNSSIDE